MSKSLFATSAIAALCTGTAFAGGHGHFGSVGHNPVDQLPNAEAGQCFARIVMPAQYESVPETVIVEEAHEKLSAVAPQFSPSAVEVKVKDQGVRYVVRQPTYETQTEQVLVKPAHERLVITPARYETVTETIQISKPRKVWKAGTNLSNTRKIDEATGQIYCLVEVPGKTKTITRTVLAQPEQVSRVSIEPEFVSVQKQVLVDRGGVDEIPTPAEFKTIPTQELIAPAHTTSSMTTPRTQTIERNVLRQPERYEWVEVLCDTNAHSSSISDLQTALKERGYYTGPIDGIIGAQTEGAVRRFQQDQGLPHQGFVTMETLRRLGLAAMTGGHTPPPYGHQGGSGHQLLGSAHQPPVQHKPVQHVKRHKPAPVKSPKIKRVVNGRLNPNAWGGAHQTVSPAPVYETKVQEAVVEDVVEVPVTEEVVQHIGPEAAVTETFHEESKNRSAEMAAEFESQAQQYTHKSRSYSSSYDAGGVYASSNAYTGGNVAEAAEPAEDVAAVADETVAEIVEEVIVEERVLPEVTPSLPVGGQQRFQRPSEYSVRRPQNWEIDQ